MRFYPHSLCSVSRSRTRWPIARTSCGFQPRTSARTSVAMAIRTRSRLILTSSLRVAFGLPKPTRRLACVRPAEAESLQGCTKTAWALTTCAAMPPFRMKCGRSRCCFARRGTTARTTQRLTTSSPGRRRGKFGTSVARTRIGRIAEQTSRFSPSSIFRAVTRVESCRRGSIAKSQRGLRRSSGRTRRCSPRFHLTIRTLPW